MGVAGMTSNDNGILGRMIYATEMAGNRVLIAFTPRADTAAYLTYLQNGHECRLPTDRDE